MKILILLLLMNASAFACKLRNVDVISLSGPITHLLKEFNLENDPHFKAKLAVHNIGQSTATSLAGGLFISKKDLKKYKNPLVIYDESKELENTIESVGVKQKYEIKTLGLDPFVVFKNSMKVFKSISTGCKEKILKLNEKVVAFKLNMLKRIGHKGPLKKKRTDYTKKTSIRPEFKKKAAVFFLGEIKEKKLPNLVMANDHFVKFLTDNKMITTYPTKLKYAPWSGKEMKRMKDALKVGVVEDNSMRAGSIRIKRFESNYINIYGNGILSPGISQVKLLPKIFQVIYK